MPFGKYRGLNLSEIPPEYARMQTTTVKRDNARYAIARPLVLLLS
jgi:hypothetical protein